MQKTISFKKKVIASAIASALAGISVSALAQSTDTVEEIVVSGIRASLIRSEEIKRSASGVVDAISAEDMGKFPDTNLAESLQRITGVAIDRVNGEGSKITVRGMGPEYNLVTLNGRQMPTAGINPTSPNYTRSFDFANLAADGVEALEVYKTGKADISTGGIGSTVNIKTPRPLDKTGFRTSMGVKAGYDTSEIDTKHVTPEVSGLISDTFFDDKVGILFLGSYSDRKNGSQKENQTNWFNLNPAVFSPGVVTDARADKTGLIKYPQSAGYEIASIETKRTNGQLVLQFAPIDTLKTTLDYTYSAVEGESNRNTFGAWFVNGGATNYVNVDKNGTAVSFQEAGGDYSWDRWHDGYKNENNSVGLNVNWNVTDSLDLIFDGHISKALSKPLDGVAGNSAGMIMGASNVVTKTFDMGHGDIPGFDFVFPATNGEAIPADIGTQFGFSRQGRLTTDIDQYQLKGIWKNTDDNSGLSAINFGVGTIKLTQESQYDDQFAHLPTWGYGGANLFDDALFTRKSTNGLLDKFSRGGKQASYYYDYTLNSVVPIATTLHTNDAGHTYGKFEPTLNQFRTIEEDTNSAFLQFDFKSQIGDMPFKMLTGVRYESTSVDSGTLQAVPESIQWTGATEFNANFSTGRATVAGKGRYEEFLPSLDASLDLSDDLKARFSYSKTLARPNIGALVADVGLGSPKLGIRTAYSGNPNLKPILSDNIDLSLEWYYDPASYVSLGFFKKNISNFIVTKVVEQPILGLTDPYAGPRAAKARAELTAAGTQTSDGNIFAQMQADQGNTSPIVGNGTDPLIQWKDQTNVNGQDGKLWGLEFAVQHMFGESGFGSSFNYTKVNGDLNYDVIRFNSQFALLGMSDTANFSAFYDKDGVQVRASYNWRDKFLNATVDNAGNNNPTFTKAYGQIDLSASYDFTDNLTVSLDGLNLLNNTQTHYGRYENEVIDATQYGTRVELGIRFKY